MFWPDEISAQEAEHSIIPKLLQTQDQFIAMLSLDLVNVDAYFTMLSLSQMTPNLFLKHLVVLSDIGGEFLQRINSSFNDKFPSNELRYLKDGQIQTYSFTSLPVRNLTNNKLKISGDKLLEPLNNNDLQLHKDVIMLLLFGSASEDETIANFLSKCEIGNYLGKHAELENFVRQRYIWVSRITGGATANTLGQLAQKYVKEYLENILNIPETVFTLNGSIPNVRDRENTTSKFDVVISKDDRYVGIEVTFQVTTNSTIERKANQARDRYEQMNAGGYKVAYVIDGAGNFQRQNAIDTLCTYSHCTVTILPPELDILAQFIREYFS